MNKTNTTAQASIQTTSNQELRAPDSFPIEVKSGVKAGRAAANLVAEPA